MEYKSQLFWKKSGDEAEVVQCPFNMIKTNQEKRSNYPDRLSSSNDLKMTKAECSPFQKINYHYMKFRQT